MTNDRERTPVILDTDIGGDIDDTWALAMLLKSPELDVRLNARHAAMCGSIHKGRAECNVRNRTPACRKVLTADWDIAMAPLDTCGLVRLERQTYETVRDCEAPLLQAVMENYRIWARDVRSEGLEFDPDTESSALSDTVAVYLAFSDEFLVMKKLGIRVTDDGRTVVDPGAKEINCALEWRDLAAFEDLLVQRLTGP